MIISLGMETELQWLRATEQLVQKLYNAFANDDLIETAKGIMELRTRLNKRIMEVLAAEPKENEDD